ncbi:hypothetical protein ACFQFH_17375 [Halobaculum halobium]
MTPDNSGATPDDPEYETAATDTSPDAALDLPEVDAEPDVEADVGVPR